MNVVKKDKTKEHVESCYGSRLLCGVTPEGAGLLASDLMPGGGLGSREGATVADGTEKAYAVQPTGNGLIVEIQH